MAQKTEQPTPKRLREARKKGHVAFSRDTSSVGTFIAGFVLILVLIPTLHHGFRDYFREIVQVLSEPRSLDTVWTGALTHAWFLSLRLIAPVVLSIALVGLSLGFAQVGLRASAHPLKPDLKKLNPMRRLKQWFSIRGMFEFLKTLLKLGLVFVLGYVVVHGALAGLLRLGLGDLTRITRVTLQVSESFLLRVALVFAVIGALDYAFQRRQWKKGLMMTKEEVKREQKEEEGDPLIRSERRALHQSLLLQNLPQAVAQADVVTINPQHRAVAVQYDRKRMAAPKVTAKGQAHLARKIVKLARRYHVPIVRDIALTRALFEVEIGTNIPQDLYPAVAEVLLFAWKIRDEPYSGWKIRNREDVKP